MHFLTQEKMKRKDFCQLWTNKVEKKDQQILLVAKYVTIVMNVWLGIFGFIY